ncbi:hypothetical protein ACFOWA_01865 [Pedobacter lithocola]|uniref:VWA domain-containing protein n=1 Tax=Pedobacter lithocola TaxID=1908239 RepID=A0ABV8P724_9SPHI
MKIIDKPHPFPPKPNGAGIHLRHMKTYNAKHVISCLLALTAMLSACSRDGQSESEAILNNDNCLPVVKAVGDQLNSAEINLFVETSGSMSGFMSIKGTSFQNNIWSIVEGFESKVGARFGIFQIRSKSEAITEVPVANFKQKLNTGGFQSAKSTDIPEMLDSIFRKANDNTVSILVSDLIFSPENGNQAQLSQISTDIRQRFKAKNRSSELIQLYSNFYGKSSVGASPYYIWVIGEAKRVKSASALLRKMITGPFNNVDFAITTPRPKYSVFPAFSQVTNALPMACPTDGCYYVYREYSDEDTPGFKFWVGMDFSALPSYMSEPAYLFKYLSVSGGTLVQVKAVSSLKEKADRQIAAKHGLTHMAQVQVDQIGGEGIVSLDLERHLPQWIDALNIDREDGLRKQTYGLKKMVKGLEEAQDDRPIPVFTEPVKIYITKQ